MNDAPIRRAIATDAAACAAVINAWIDQTDWIPRTASHSEIESALANGLPKREAFVVGEPVVGYLSLDPAENHIWGLYVSAPSQGLGKALLERAKTDRNYLKLNTHLPNESAHRFYRREGFQAMGNPWPGEDGIEEFTMEWWA
jgi:GNAT superfamily N-acetyltransferase